MRFVFDFINDCKSELFKHVVINRQAYESLLGKNNVLNTLDIIIQKELERDSKRAIKCLPSKRIV
jgi:hypothetical protein